MDMNREIKILSFDYGGTLCHDLEESHVALQRILNNLGFKFEISRVSEAWRDAHLWWSNVKRETGAVMNAENFVRLFQRTVLNLGIPDSESMLVARQLFERWPYEVKIKAYEDVIPTLSELKSANFKLIVISNISCKRNLGIYLERAGILKYFDALIASGDVGYEKPNPEIFKVSSKILGVPLNSILHVGDSYEADYLGACNAGLNALLIDRRGVYTNKECWKISSLTELINIVLRH